MKNNDSHLSKFLAYVLRHKPEAIGLKLDKNGWAPLATILANTDTPITLDQIRDICAADSKGRYILDEPNGRIRAAQGHSVKVDLQLKAVHPPKELYHGTAVRFLPDILKQGLKPMNRHHVHLTDKKDTAYDVGRRHSKEVAVLTILAGQMALDGFKFYQSENGVYLTDAVFPKYIIGHGALSDLLTLP
jgi:putative RNA 2'-phosphotransferase